MGVLMDRIQARQEAGDGTGRPWICRLCRLVNWPNHMDGTLRAACHKCGAPRFPARVEYR